jgi:outer membrane autotransporter protein
LTVNGTTQTTTDAIAGASVAHRITEKVTGTLSAGVVQNISYSAGNVSGSSEIANLSTFNSNMPGSGYTSAVLGAGVSYDVAKNQRIGVNVGWQQKSLINTSVGSIGANYTIGF